MAAKQVAYIALALLLGGAGLLFYSGRTTEDSDASNLRIIGGIVPHHDLIPEKIEEFWLELDRRADPSMIVLIGPDHEDAGPGELSAVQCAPFEGVRPDEQFINGLIRDRVTARDDGTLQNEHSLTIHLPFIARIFPDATVVPIAIRADAGNDPLLATAAELRKRLSGEVAVVASVDLSHYESRTVAMQNDLETIAAITNFDYDVLHSYEADHIDSEQSVILMSEIVCPEHTCNWDTVFTGNSSDIQHSNPGYTTGYCSLIVDGDLP
ncbi:MAG: AmmeMemoRadiSam system protein B [Candidatus Kerfeldbacteria bacterium]